MNIIRNIAETMRDLAIITALLGFQYIVLYVIYLVICAVFGC